MEASPALIAVYEASLPADERVERKKMFGMPCAFVNRQMFYGTFENTVVARIGPDRVQALLGKPGIKVFSPMPDRAWKDYVQVEITVEVDILKMLAAEALRWTLKLPAKAPKPKESRQEKKAKAKAKKAAARPNVVEPEDESEE